MAERTAPSGEFFSTSKGIAAIALLALCAAGCGLERDQNGSVVPGQTIDCADVSRDAPGIAPADEDPSRVTVKDGGTTKKTFYLKETATGVGYSDTLSGPYANFAKGEAISVQEEGLRLKARKGLLGYSIEVIC